MANLIWSSILLYYEQWPSRFKSGSLQIIIHSNILPGQFEWCLVRFLEFLDGGYQYTQSCCRARCIFLQVLRGLIHIRISELFLLLTLEILIIFWNVGYGGQNWFSFLYRVIIKTLPSLCPDLHISSLWRCWPHVVVSVRILTVSYITGRPQLSLRWKLERERNTQTPLHCQTGPHVIT